MTSIVISAFGCSTPLGGCYQSVKTALEEGLSGIRRIEKYDTSEFRSKHAGVPTEGNERIRWPSEHGSQIGDIYYADVAIKRLRSHPGFSLEQYDESRVGCFIGADEPVYDMQQTFDVVRNLGRAAADTERDDALKRHFKIGDFFNYDPTVVLNRVGRAVSYKGPAVCHLGLCSASLQAIGMGFQALRADRVDAAIVGGVSAKITPEHYIGLEAADVISTDDKFEPTQRSRPFDSWRSGYIPAEGAIFFLLERREAVEQRADATCLLEILGYGASHNAFHIVKPHIESREMILSMTRAIEDAGIGADRVDLVNAHGTSTQLNDFHEAKAINEVLPPGVLVTANKSLHGHLIAAAGAMETLNTLIHLREGFIPGTINVEHQDPQCQVNLVTKTVKAEPQIVLKNSFGMGGLAASMVFKSCH